MAVGSTIRYPQISVCLWVTCSFGGLIERVPGHIRCKPAPVTAVMTDVREVLRIHRLTEDMAGKVSTSWVFAHLAFQVGGHPGWWM